MKRGGAWGGTGTGPGGYRRQTYVAVALTQRQRRTLGVAVGDAVMVPRHGVRAHRNPYGPIIATHAGWRGYGQVFDIPQVFPAVWRGLPWAGSSIRAVVVRAERALVPLLDEGYAKVHIVVDGQALAALLAATGPRSARRPVVPRTITLSEAIAAHGGRVVGGLVPLSVVRAAGRGLAGAFNAVAACR